MAERTCRKCGCTENKACIGGCYWVDVDLCSECVTHVDEVKTLNSQAYNDKSAVVNAFLNDKENHQIKYMKRITIPVSSLIAVLKKIKEVITSKTALEVLSNVLIKVRESEIQIIATDLANTLLADVNVTNDHETGYEFLLPFPYLLDICNNTNDLVLTVDLVSNKKKTGYTAVITTFSDEYKIEDLRSADEWPKMPEFPQGNSIGIADDFIDCLNSALAIVLPEGSLRPALEKVLIDITNQGLIIASTNAHAIYEKSFPVESPHTASLLVSPKIIKALKGFTETSISWSDTHICFISSNITLIGTIQDEQFPNYRMVMPESSKNLTVSHAELTGMMEKIMINKVKDSIPVAELFFKKKKGHIVAETYNKEYNRRIKSEFVANYTGDCDKMYMDPQLLLKLLGQIKYVTLSLSIFSHDRGVVIETDSDNSYRALIMPSQNQD